MSYLICFEHYAKNAKWKKNTWAIQLSALLSGSAGLDGLAVHLLERGPKDLVELTTWAQEYLIVHKQQLHVRVRSKTTVQHRCAEQR